MKFPEKKPGAPEGKRAQNRKKRLNGFREAAVELFDQYGLEAVTVEAITKHAGVAKGSFYRYFSGKEQLVAWLFQPFRESLTEVFNKCEEELLCSHTREGLLICYQNLAEELQELFSENLILIWIYLQDSRAPEIGARKPLHSLRRQFLSDAIKLTKVAHTRKLWKPILPMVSASAVIGAVEAMLYSFLREELEVSPEVAIKQLMSLVLKGLFIEKE